jgi:hypothetical protein
MDKIFRKNMTNRFILDCQCHAVGSMDEFCDGVTGQCTCKTNVMGRDCSQCHVNTYNMSRDGCMPCTCNADGSSSLQCDDTGQCPCSGHVTGLKCTQCSLGYYGLPTKPCEGTLVVMRDLCFILWNNLLSKNKFHFQNFICNDSYIFSLEVQYGYAFIDPVLLQVET